MEISILAQYSTLSVASVAVAFKIQNACKTVFKMHVKLCWEIVSHRRCQTIYNIVEMLICFYILNFEIFVELGLCLCSRLPGKVDNQTEVTRGQSQ